MEMKNGVVHTIQTAFKSLKEKVDYYRQALDNLNNQADGLKRSTHEQIADIERRVSDFRLQSTKIFYSLKKLSYN